MTTEQKFDCIFCKDVFDNKEELQVHFRKHADPKFKSKNRFQADPQVDNDKVKDAEMVSCDVCSQMFSTISKAITHKHKVHPDYDVKYFCPWCGKLFTMKHPYNVHIQTSHGKQEQVEDKIFHCDCCDVDFFLPSAIMYHNKFFHRQDTDIPDVGTSKKLRRYNQEILNLHYCAFCGEEYENKVNLFKHITDDHGDENQSPEEVLRCPLCEAIFYHLDAYEIHLTYHSTEDLYSVQNELFAELLDFSLETVPPMIEKVEDCREDFEAEAHSQDTDAESSMNAVGIEKFLELAMGQAEDSNPAKVKKKKHKKSKKSAAITLDEFLSMNQDVFGEGLDFQGVEEVPTRVVAKQLKNNRKSINAATSAELEKLKQKGIMVMKVAGSRPKKITQKIVNRTTTKELKTSSEVLTKLMNQSNNQIKIVKKSIPSTAKDDTGQINTTMVSTSTCNQNTNKDIETKDKLQEENKNSDKTVQSCSKPKDPEVDAVNNLSFPETDECLSNSTSGNICLDTTIKNTELKNDETLMGNNMEANCSQNCTNHSEQSSKITEHDSKLSEESECLNSNNQPNENQVDEDKSDFKMVDKDKVIETESITCSNKESDEIEGSSNKISVSPVVNSLSTLKHLSNLTVKPVSQIKNTNKIATDEPTEKKKLTSCSTYKHLSDLTFKPVNQSKTTSVEMTKDEVSKTDEKVEDEGMGEENDKVRTRLVVSTDSITSVKTPVIEEYPTLDAVTSLNKNITVQSLSTSTKGSIDNNYSDDDHEVTDEVPNTSNIKVKDKSGNKDLTIKKIKVENDEHLSNNKVINAVNKAVQNKQSVHFENNINTSISDLKNPKSKVDITENSVVKSSTDILKYLPNITTKVNKPVFELKPVKTSFDGVLNSPLKGNANILKHLPNITTKPVLKERKKSLPPRVIKQTNTPIKIVETSHKEEEIIEISDIDDSDDEAGKIIDTKEETKQLQSKQDSKKSADALKNLSKHITVKSINQPILKNIKIEKTDEDQNEKFNSDDDQRSNAKVCSQKLSNRSMSLKNALRNIGQNITVKSGTSSPCQSVTSQDRNSQDFYEGINEAGVDLDADIGKIQITEMENDNDCEKSDDFVGGDKERNNKSPIVESPHNSGSENEDQGETDFETEIRATTVQKTNNETINNKNAICLNNLKNISKSLTIKSLNSNSTDNNEKHINHSEESLEVVQTQTKQLTTRPPKQFIKGFPKDDTATSMNTKRKCQIVDQSDESLNQNVSINKEVTVKTFHTKTVIQEITTTVTKTIKTVNQTVKQETRNSSQMNIPVLPQKVQGMRPSTSKNLQGVVIRHAGPKPNNVVSQQFRPVGTVIRPSRQVVPTRPSLNVARTSTPRLPTIKNNLPKSSPNKQVLGTPLKFSSSAITTKRPHVEEKSGPFSCFKKPKESLIPVSDVPTFGSAGESIQVKAASHTSTNYMSTSKMVKGSSVVTATQVKSEVTSMQQLSRVNNAVGIKVRNSKVQTQAQDDSVNKTSSDSNSMKRTTLEAIEKLQKQGLLVKKPRIDENENSDSDHADDNVSYSSTDEKETEHDE